MHDGRRAAGRDPLLLPRDGFRPVGTSGLVPQRGGTVASVGIFGKFESGNARMHAFLAVTSSPWTVLVGCTENFAQTVLFGISGNTTQT